MEYQFVEEISKFWQNLFFPILMGSITIIFTLWIIGPKMRNALYNKILNYDNKSNYVLQNGIYIPKQQTKSIQFKNYISKKFIPQNFSPFINLFLIILLMYGFNIIITSIFLPNIISVSPNKIFVCGVDDTIIAHIWQLAPDIQDIFQLINFIDTSCEYNTNELVILFSLESYFYFLYVYQLLHGLQISYMKKGKKEILKILY